MNSTFSSFSLSKMKKKYKKQLRRRNKPKKNKEKIFANYLLFKKIHSLFQISFMMMKILMMEKTMKMKKNKLIPCIQQNSINLAIFIRMKANKPHKNLIQKAKTKFKIHKINLIKKQKAVKTKIAIRDLSLISPSI